MFFFFFFVLYCFGELSNLPCTGFSSTDLSASVKDCLKFDIDFLFGSKKICILDAARNPGLFIEMQCL